MSKCSIYVVRIPRVNDKLEYLNYSKPCAHCYNIIKTYGIKNIIYSDFNNEVSINKMSNLDCSYITKGNQRVHTVNEID